MRDFECDCHQCRMRFYIRNCGPHFPCDHNGILENEKNPAYHPDKKGRHKAKEGGRATVHPQGGGPRRERLVYQIIFCQKSVDLMTFSRTTPAESIAVTSSRRETCWHCLTYSSSRSSRCTCCVMYVHK